MAKPNYIAGHVKLTDVSVYPSLLAAEGCIVACQIEDTGCSTHLYHVSPESLETLGCNVGTCQLDYPFYDSEVSVVAKQE